MAHPTGSGEYELRRNPKGYLLFNFDISGARLKPEHEDFIDGQIVPRLRDGRPVKIVGLASRSGTAEYNLRLSGWRAWSVRAYLRRRVGSKLRVEVYRAFGEEKAKHEGYKDGTEDKRFRSVLLLMDTRPPGPGGVEVPVPDQIDPTPEPDAPVPDTPLIADLGKFLDIVGVATGFAEIFLLGTLATVMASISAVAGMISAMLALPAAWIEADRKARFNGHIYGYAKAMQLMADQYFSRLFETLPLDEWPPIRRPHVPDWIDPQNQLQSAYHTRLGRREGERDAYETVMKMERQPLEREIFVNGKRRTVRMTGKLWLAIMARKRFDRVRNLEDEIIHQVRKKLRSKGEDFPIM